MYDLTSPGAAMAYSALNNLGDIALGGAPRQNPLQAYQQAIAQRAALRQQELLQQAQQQRLNPFYDYEQALQRGYIPEGTSMLDFQRMQRGITTGPRIGTYNPRDYTTDSWAQFIETNDPNVLERSEQFTVGGVRYDAATGMPVVDVNRIASNAAQIESAEQFARNQEKWRASESSLLSSISSAQEKAGVISDIISDAEPLLNEWTTGFGGILGNLPDTDARRLRNILDTVRANVAFTTLMDMRNSSPTGGALGSVSEQELNLLMSALGSLDQLGNVEDLRRALGRIQRINQGALDRLENAYEMDRKRYTGETVNTDEFNDLPPNIRVVED